jgi:hypothetical protein
MQMRLAAIAIVLAVAAPAGAAPIPFTGTLKVDFGAYGRITVTGGGVADNAGPGGSLSIPAGVFTLAATMAISPPLIVIDGLGVGARGLSAPPFAPGSSKALSFDGTTGKMGLDASAYVLTSGVSIVRKAPLVAVGVGPVFFCNVTPVCLQGTDFRLGPAALTLRSNPTIVGSGFDNRTLGGGGVLQLVSPSYVVLSPIPPLPTFATLTIRLVPEPGTALLVGAGLAALVSLARRNRSPSRSTRAPPRPPSVGPRRGRVSPAAPEAA